MPFYIDDVQTDSNTQSLAARDPKESVRVATTANLSSLSGEQTIDGVSVVAGNRVLVKNQNTGSANGLYVCANGAWSRSLDADTSEKVTCGCRTYIEEGTVNAKTQWVLTTINPIVLGSTSLVFEQIVEAGTGLTRTKNSFAVDYGSTGTTACVGNDSRLSDNRTDSNAIHKSTAAEISTITEKTTLVDADLFVIEDSAASNAKKKVQFANIKGNGTPAGAKGDVQYRGNTAIFEAESLFNYDKVKHSLTLGPAGAQLADNPLSVNANVNSYAQANVQNLSSGTTASTDMVCTADTGSDVSKYVDMGINGSGNTDTSWGEFSGPLDGYFYCCGGSLAIGTDTAKDLVFFTGGTLDANVRMKITALGSLVMGAAALATNATDGFVYVGSCAGTPTGTPTAFSGRTPITVDTTNNKVYFYTNGAWRAAMMEGATAGGDLAGMYPSPTVAKASKSFLLTGGIAPSSIGSDQNDYNPTGLADATSIRLTASGAYNITGLAGGVGGRMMILHNASAYKLTIVNESANSTAANRFLHTSAQNLVLNPDQNCELQYCGVCSRWRIVSASRAPYGTTVDSICQGNDSRLSDSRTPTSHAASHKSAGGDAIKLDELAAPTDVTTLDASTDKHGLLPKLGGGTTNFLRADGTWAAPPGGGSQKCQDISVSLGTNTYFPSTAASYEVVHSFIFRGTTTMGTPTGIDAIAWADSGVTTAIRIIDLTNSNNVICANESITNSSKAAVSLGTLSNLPTGKALFEIQIYRKVGSSSNKANIAGIQVQW